MTLRCRLRGEAPSRRSRASPKDGELHPVQRAFIEPTRSSAASARRARSCPSSRCSERTRAHARTTCARRRREPLPLRRLPEHRQSRRERRTGRDVADASSSSRAARSSRARSSSHSFSSRARTSRSTRRGTEFTEISASRAAASTACSASPGSARYTQDVYLAGHARTCACCAAPIRGRACGGSTRRRPRQLPGVRDILHRFNAPKAAYRGEDTIFREEVRFVGEEVAAVAADDEQTAVEALRLIEVDYELLPHVVDLEEAIGDMAPRLDTRRQRRRGGDAQARRREACAEGSRRSSSTRPTGPRRRSTTRSRRTARSRRGMAISSRCTSRPSTCSASARDSRPR